MAHAGGRPPKYQTIEELQPLLDSYFEKNAGRLTVTGLALHLGFTSRQALLNYEVKPEFVDAIKTAKLRIEAFYEENLLSKNLGGAIFALKNFGWRDKTEVEQTGSMTWDVTLNVNGSAAKDQIHKALGSGVSEENT